ncbi:MAG: RidA family protein [Rhodospirillales bacterium]|nr:RidA family protein [Rhodospirillales bacterium]MBO6785631.1 RidA family protein [Rhodospirillales bacterium]
MISRHSPASIAPPSSDYSHGVKVTDAKTWMHISGQIGTHADGRLAGDSAMQMEVCWERIFAVLDDADMSKDNIVKVTVFLTKPEDVGLYRQVRDRMLDGHICASTLLIVSGLADPSWTVEIEAIAAK